MLYWEKTLTKGLSLLLCAVLAVPALPQVAAADVVKERVAYKRTEKLYQQFIGGDEDEGGEPNIAMLNLFMTKMPKGGDLHHHYSGTIYAETYLKWVKEKGWFIDKNTLRVLQTADGEGSAAITVDELMADELLYRDLMMHWSDRDFDNHYHDQPPPDVNFFSTFGYFGGISSENVDLGLQIIKQRAVDENVAYIETQLKRVGERASNYFDDATRKRYNEQLRATTSQEELDAILEPIRQELLQNPVFVQAVQNYTQRVARYHTGIDDDRFMMRYQTYAVRVLPPVQVFLDLFSGYLAAEQSPWVVGVNIVSPEHHAVSLADYTLHMRMYNFLLNHYPDVNRALHAGELTLGMVRPEDLRFHMTQAREIAQAQRIGHGIDLPYEADAVALLQDLKENAVVEINLTSNEFILGVSGSEHPYNIYAHYGVPMVICTDDSGVSRNNLANEYVLLASRYRPDYKKVKEFVYNSITYSFMTADEKEKMIALLDRQFIVFEKEMETLLKRLRREKERD